eukprot:scaffold59672_cov18-Tisochrysis_lutea.AAC.2
MCVFAQKRARVLVGVCKGRYARGSLANSTSHLVGVSRGVLSISTSAQAKTCIVTPFSPCRAFAAVSSAANALQQCSKQQGKARVLSAAAPTMTSTRLAPSAAASTAAGAFVTMRPTKPPPPPDSIRLATTTGTPAQGA